MMMRLKIQVLEPSILMQISSDPISLSFVSRWNHPIAKSVEQRWLRQLGGDKREIEDLVRRGTSRFITPLYILDTFGICGLAVFVSKIHSLDSNPLLYYHLVQKGIQS